MILTIDGVEIKETGDIIKVRDAHEVGEDLVIVVERDGSPVTLTLTIGDSADYN
jgi:serine protease Do